MKIYRVESKLDGQGPFTSIRVGKVGSPAAIWYEESAEHDQNPQKYPGTFQDGIMDQVHDFDKDSIAIGCDSMLQLAYWFNSYRMINALNALGFVIREYNVPDSNCFYGNSLKQVGFMFYGGWRSEYPSVAHDILSLETYQENRV